MKKDNPGGTAGIPEIEADAHNGESLQQGPIHVAALMEASTITGPAKNLLRFCESSAAGGVRVTILTFLRGDVATNQFIETARRKGIQVEIIPEEFAFDPRITLQLRRKLAELKPNVFQTHGVKGHFLARLLRPDLPWLAFHHGYTVEDLKMKAFNQLNRWSLPGADLVITVCQPFARHLEQGGVKSKRLRVLPNSIDSRPMPDISEREALRRQWGIAEHECVILSVGRFSPEKGHTTLVEAVAKLKTRRPNLPFHLLLVGDGGERANIAEMLRVRNLLEQTVFTGHQRDTWPYYWIADLFVLPSLSEGSPNVLLEAMSAGLPIIATAVGGVPETVTDGVSALITAPGNPDALSVAIESLLADRNRANRLAENALLQSGNFSPVAYRDSLCSIYRELLARQRDHSNEPRPGS